MECSGQEGALRNVLDLMDGIMPITNSSGPSSAVMLGGARQIPLFLRRYQPVTNSYRQVRPNHTRADGFTSLRISKGRIEFGKSNSVSQWGGLLQRHAIG